MQIGNYNQKRKSINYGPVGFVTNNDFYIEIVADGDNIKNAELNFNYKYKNLEKLIENNNLLYNLKLIQNIWKPLSFCYELALLSGAEKIIGLPISIKDELIRIFFSESERIISHLIGLAEVIKLTGISIFFVQSMRFRNNFLKKRELIFKKQNFYQLLILGGVKKDIEIDDLYNIYSFLINIKSLIFEMEKIMSNIAFKNRTINIGTISKKLAEAFSLSGPNARASGINYDIRKINFNSAYNMISFEIPLSDAGDVYSRCYIRIEEIKQSLDILLQCINLLKSSEFNIYENQYLIEDNGKINKGQYSIRQIYNSVESPRGEFGMFLVTEETDRLYRCKINGASTNAAQALEQIFSSSSFSDIGIIIKSLDIHINEISR
ncbi:MAG: hypothetical protein LBS83_00185 [Holosporales bacterium]|jgi:NADH-quinone oxidoreductase subunit D|nr:hypothetical protein [Holosporales bacterium]